MSQVLSTYASAIKLLFLKWPVWLLVFICNFIFALFIALPFSRLLDQIAAYSEAPLQGLKQFDIYFIGDIINNYGPELHMIWGQVLIFVLLYLILNIFLAGGLIENYIHVFERFSMSAFFANCAKHFWCLFRLALYFIVVQIIVVAFLIFIYGKLGLSPFELDSEMTLISRSRMMLFIFVILFIWIDMVLECAKVILVAQRKRGFVLPYILRTKFFVLRNFFSVAALYILCTLTFLFILGLYAVLNDIFNMTSMTSIVIAFLLAQVYLFLRVGSRLLYMTTAVDFLRNKIWGLTDQA